MSAITRATAFVASFVDKLSGADNLYQTVRHPIQLGRDWYSLSSVDARKHPRHRIVLRFVNYRYPVTLEGSVETICSRLAELLEHGFCANCGGQGGNNHVCDNLEIEYLNNREGLKCSICLDNCNGATRLPCGHPFHWSCLTKHFEGAHCAHCPNCRKRARRCQWDTHFTHDEDEEDTEADDDDE